MADTKPISATKISLTSLALGIAIVGGSIYYLDPGTDEMRPVEQVAPVDPFGLIENADPKCAAEIRLRGPLPVCSKTGATELHGKWTTDLWECDGAIMKAEIQTCLDEAQAKAEKAKAEKPAEEPIGEMTGDVGK
jgi:hypothetical protein